jgi:succinate-semialdehyde dehydrogenase/glutarate-semialdehyde dehydrogenase
MYSDFGLLIDNRWQGAASGLRTPVHSPATEDPIGDVPKAGVEDVARVVASAERGFAAWRETPAWERSRVLRRAADLIRERREPISLLMSTESGKPRAQARAEVNDAADQFEWYAEEAKRIYGQTIPARLPDQRLTLIYQPVGVCLSLSAWNFPALLPARKFAAALAAGCAVIGRPAGETPGSCFALAQALVDAGTPPGAVTIITGPARMLAEALIDSPAVRKISLTGSVAVGKSVLARAAAGVKRVTMELGGHAPVIVHRDVDPVSAARSAATAKFRNAGQVCISPTRFYVHESLKEPFATEFVAVAREIRLGDGRDEAVTMGPMIRARAVDTAIELIEDARRRGARVLHGGRRPAHLNKGHFLEPTVLADVPDDARIMVEEPFAPVASLTTFSDEEEVLERANALPFGLAGYVFSNDAERAMRTAEGLEVGMVGINELRLAAAELPFGGVKESGFGREGGSLGIFDYLEPKAIRHRLARQ